MKKLLWVDLEMTGLDVEKERVIEVAGIITDMEFNELDTYHSIVKQPQTFLDAMDEWNTTHHGDSGLTAAVPNGKEPELVESELCTWLDKHFSGSKERPILCGNSIFQDRRFIDAYFKKLAGKLHYRMLDVTSWKIMMEPLFDLKYEKKDAHRAVDDIRESIAELKFYIENYQAKPL